MRLTKLYIHNYKSFYDTTIELDKLNIVVGENNSGKSNLIDVLEFIDIAMSKDIERAISDKGGYDKIKNYSAVGEEKVIVRATFDKTLIISFSFTQNYEILSEYLDKKYIICHKKYFNNNKLYRKKIFICSSKKKKSTVVNFLSILVNSSQISTYYFDAQKIRMLSNQNSEYSQLLKDGSNLGKILFEIKEKDKNRFEIISNSLITTVNEIDGIEIYNVAGNYIIAFKERGKEPIPIHIVSDGTINFLATMTALNQIDSSSLLVFEEPERHLHFKVVNYLLDSFRHHDKQILITSHSTEMLKYANLDEVIFIYRDSDGDTQTIRADKIPNLKEKMEYMSYERPMSLDEIIDNGLLGSFE
jgi:predicted ATPase